MKRKSYLKHFFVCLRRYWNLKSVNGSPKGYLKEKIQLLKNVAQQWEVPYFVLAVDYFFTFLRHGESIQYYVIEELYKYGRLEKKKRLTAYRAFKLDYKYNIDTTQEEKDKIHRKNEFNTIYQEFLHRDWLFPKEASKEEIIAFVKTHDKVFCKPNIGSQGDHAFILSFEELNDSMIERLINEEFILEELITQSKEMALLHEQSINTIRIFTIIDRDGNIHIAQPLLRVGIGCSVVDNVSKGGMFYLVDADTGIVYSRGKTQDDRTLFIKHPGTNIIMPGFQVPQYKEICQMVMKAAAKNPKLRYVGWDVAIAEEGPVLVEGNIEFAATIHGSDGRYKEVKQYL